MRFKLMLFLANNIKIEILESEQLIDIDILTTKYKDDTALIKASSNTINNYFCKEVDIDAFLGMISDQSFKICFYDQGGYYKKISPLYKDNKKILNPVSILNCVTKFLKDDVDYTETIRFLDKFMYMFSSQFNIERNNIYGLKRTLSMTDTSRSVLSVQQKSFDKILKIIKSDLKISSDDIAKNQIRYVNLRVIYEYIVNRYSSSLAKKVPSTGNIKEAKQNYQNVNCHVSSTESFFDQFLNLLLKEEDFCYTTMGDLAYMFEEYMSEPEKKVRVKK